MKFVTVESKPIEGQVMGTSGLRKKVAEVTSHSNYLENFVEAIFRAVNSKSPIAGTTWVCGGDGRYLNKTALEVIVRIAAAWDIKKIVVGRDGHLSTPAASHLIRVRHAAGGLLMTASHNPGGVKGDFGLKLNMPNGGPAPKEMTDEVQRQTKLITSFRIAESYAEAAAAIVEWVDPADAYVEMIKAAFDVPAIKEYVAKTKLRAVVDSLHAITGDYTKRVFCDELGLPLSCLHNNVPKEDFGGGHPDPNLTYAHSLVENMHTGNYDFGCAFDGDGDRNMIMGHNGFFVTPSDSLAVICANRQYIKHLAAAGGFTGVARSMPTSAAVDRVAKAEGITNLFETPTGWKFFGNLLDAGKISLCGEESFGTGAGLIREKDGIWAAMAWLSILAGVNKDRHEGNFLGVGDVVQAHWARYGRNFYCRYDYEECDAVASEKLMGHLRAFIKTHPQGTCHGFKLALVDDFEYVDPVDHSVTDKQGVRFIFEDGTRAIFRLSGTGSVGATVRVYFDQYEANPAKVSIDAKEALYELITLIQNWAQIKQFTGREKPTVIT